MAKKRLPPWRVVSSDPIHHIEVVPRTTGRDGFFDVTVVGRKHYKRDIKSSRSCHPNDREYVQDERTHLSYMLNALKVSEKEGVILDLLNSGLAVVVKLAGRYSWYLQKAAEKEKKDRKKNAARDKIRRAKERAQEAKYKAQEAREKKAAEAAKKKQQEEYEEKQRLARIEETKAKAREERLKREALAEKKRLEEAAKKSAEAEERFRAKRYWNQTYDRRLEA